jgi:isoprenylcysteine carboxyl methyltransferase (ICMT) family protein YpbQ
LNGVKLATKKEYDSEVAAIIPEDVFRMITNPFYFTSMKPEAQKEILLDKKTCVAILKIIVNTIVIKISTKGDNNVL